MPPIDRISPGPEYGDLFSAAAAWGDLVIVGGTTAWDVDPGGGVEAQARAILGKFDRFLAAAGSDKSRVLFVQVYLADIETWDEMNRAWLAWVAPGAVPARVSVQAKLLQGLKVEMTCVAVRARP
ncbi:MAG: RidA family protein [Alphaproteobacteria bacterium]|nr:RidA family protein [Alphaproteobacteria bacterium]